MDEKETKHVDQAIKEYEYIYKRCGFVKGARAAVEMSKGIAMKARDLEREANTQMVRKFVFTITAYNLEQKRWDRCPGCGDPDINQHSSSGHPWQGCYKCDILLGSNGTIKSMDHSRDKKKPTSSELASPTPEQPPV